MFEIIILLVITFVAYKALRLYRWTRMINQYKQAAIRLGLDGNEALDRLQLYWKMLNFPMINGTNKFDGKTKFREMMQPNGIQSDPHVHTVQVVWFITDDILAGKYN